jgi:hypothetical protein
VFIFCCFSRTCCRPGRRSNKMVGWWFTACLLKTTSRLTLSRPCSIPHATSSIGSYLFSFISSISRFTNRMSPRSSIGCYHICLLRRIRSFSSASPQSIWPLDAGSVRGFACRHEEHSPCESLAQNHGRGRRIIST